MDDRLGILSVHPSMGDDGIKGLAQGDLLLDARDGAVLLKFLEKLLWGHLVALGHIRDAPSEFVTGDGYAFLADDLAQNEVKFHLVAGTLTGGTKELFLMRTELLL